MQHPREVDFSCRENIRAIMDFHEGKHTLPERFGKLAHHVLLADSLGDDNFVQEIAMILKLLSNRQKDDKLRLRRLYRN